ncbi:MAG: hypothetical protein AAFX09_10105 [Pseudomonadota bacterium]
MSPLFLPIAFGLAAAAVCLLAVVLVRMASGFTRANAPLFAAFAAGLVISVAILHMMPEALNSAPNAPLLILAGFAGGFILHRLIEAGAHLSGAGEERRISLLAIAPVLAIALHSLVDGGVYAISLTADAFTGMQAVLGLVIHELPETVICFVLLQRAGLSDRSAGLWAFLAAGVTTLAATLVAAPFAVSLSPALLGAAFAVVAGLLLHVGAGHLLAEAGERGWLRAAPALAAGGALAVAMSFVHLHPHGEHDGPHIGAPHFGPHLHHDHDDHDHPHRHPVAYTPPEGDPQ